ncbi:nitroreductase [Sphingomonas gilva]|uniref:Nitroreductase n=1 Tax=Sphingomonas gilva TaxID=2305907 RepID=A0A396RWF9_9SPHN|nr:nitroreductase [Sphingomonas gilva]RHW18803.1 nitroreductase [Sphingomonas gilva]
MKVSEALASRRSVRGFLDKPVDPNVLRRVLTLAGRAPSGGNLQPWHVAVVTGRPLAALVDAVAARIAAGAAEPAEYAVYPANLPEPYRSRRFAVGEEMYGHLGIPREDRAARLAWFAANYRFFGAPVGLFVHTPRFMGPPQWADLGIWLQSVMLLLREEGLDSCPQEAWAMWPRSVRAHVPIPEEHILYAGMSIGWADPAAPANRTRAERAPIEETTTFLGF